MALFDVILAATLINLAELYKEEGRYADAEPLYKRALATWKKALGPDRCVLSWSEGIRLW